MRPSPFALERFFAEHEFSAPYLLCCSDCESVRVEELTSATPNGLQGLLDLQLRYGDSHGEPALREAIARLYETIEPQHILVFTGAEEAIFAFVHSMLDSGD
ncbi:MAG: aminotransferase class I/II-fold pyridoxal phosphate-dependent enzyme, partial [Oceanidesulfovibrio sp.]